VSDVKVQQKQALSRQEAARLIAALAEGLGEDGKVTVQLENSTLELSVTDEVDWELEVEVDGDEIELELELKWSRSGRATAEAAEEESEENESEELQPELVSGEDDAGATETGRDAVAEDAEDGESPEDDEPGDAEAVPASEPEQTPRPRRGRRSASAGAGKSAFKRYRHRRCARVGRGQRPHRLAARSHQGRGVTGVPGSGQLTYRPRTLKLSKRFVRNLG
jgi:amphi-Trp domain-containing protein